MGCAGVMGNWSGGFGVGTVNTALPESDPCLIPAKQPRRRNRTPGLSSSSAALSSRWGWSPISLPAVPRRMEMAERPLSPSRTTRLRLRQPSRPHLHPRRSLRPQPSLLRLLRLRPLRPDATLSFLITASGGHSAVPAVCMSACYLRGGGGFAALVRSGRAKAGLEAKGEPVPLAAELDISRFKEGRFIEESVAAGVAH